MAVYLVPLTEGRPIVLDKAVVFVGRHPDCDVVLKDSRKVSRKHCCLAQVDDRIMIRDLGSMNGMRLNGKRIVREAVVRVGDKLTIGDVTYILKAGQGSPRTPEGSRSTTGQPTGRPAHPAHPANRPDPALIQLAESVDLSQSYPVPIPEDYRAEQAGGTGRSERGRSPQDEFTAPGDSDELEFGPDDD